MSLSYASLAVVPSSLDVLVPRERHVITPGSLLRRRQLRGATMVNARDLDGREWMIPARAVWHDVDIDGRREHPWSVGLAHGASAHVAVLAGLSDRLGWEAWAAHRRGRHLPVVDELGSGRSDDTVVYDGRLGHDVPTALVMSERAAFWGAGATMAAAYHRALFSDRGELGGRGELDKFAAGLAEARIEVVAVDLSTAVMAGRGLHRVSVQLVLG